MFITLCKQLVRIITGKGRPPRSRAVPVRRPLLESLEARTVPSTATHFLVLTPPVSTAGDPANVEVLALDASNHLATSYTGTVQLTDSDTATTLGSTALPTTYTFAARDHGAHDFVLDPGTAGTETVTATDTTTTSITGSSALVVDAAPVATHFLVLAGKAEDGVATTVRVIALDASNHVVTDYTGTVQLSSTDSATSLPSAYTFTSRDHGEHDFTITPGAVGTETITATDTNNATLVGSVTLTVTAAPVATHFQVVVPENAVVGQSTPVLVEALDASNHIVSNYTGTVQLTSSDTAATVGGTALPATVTFSSTDHGVHVFLVTFETTGSQTVTATDSANSLSGVASTLVQATAPTSPHRFGGFWGF